MATPLFKAIWIGCLSGAIALLISIFMGMPPGFHAGHSAIAQTSPEITQRITSVSQLSDVNPSDPYFPALQGLVERYGCVSGFPDNTFRADQPATRGEVAIVLYSCLQKMSELIQAGALEPGS